MKNNNKNCGSLVPYPHKEHSPEVPGRHKDDTTVPIC